MQIHLNGESRTVEAALTLAALLEQAGLAGRRVAVEVNSTIVPAAATPNTGSTTATAWRSCTPSAAADAP